MIIFIHITLLTYLAQNPANYKYPSSKSLKKLAKKTAEKKKEEIQEQLEDVEDCPITADGWTSTKQKMGFVAVTIHFFVKGLNPFEFQTGLKK